MEVTQTLTVANWEPIEGSGYLVGRFSLTLSCVYGALTIHGVAVFREIQEHAERRWIMLPSRKYFDQASGDSVRCLICEFGSRTEWRAFQADVLRALEDAGVLR